MSTFSRQAQEALKAEAWQEAKRRLKQGGKFSSFKLPIETESELANFVQSCFGITIPNKVVISGHSTPWRAFCDSYFARHRVTVWKASRGFGGKSFLLALLGLTEALTLKCDVKVLGGSGKQSQGVQDYISQDFYNYKDAPKGIWKGEPLTTISRFIWGNSIEALMASQTSVRGPHVPRLRLDEADEMSLAILDAALGQTMAKVNRETSEIIVPAQTTISSTHHNPDGTMTEILKRAKEKGWPVHEWSYHESMADGNGWLLASEIADKKDEVTSTMWNVEFEMQQPSAEGLAIDRNKVEAMFDKSLGEFAGRPGEYIEIERPVSGETYSTGADWAKKNDFTDIMTSRELGPKRYQVIVYERRRREPWPKMVERFDKRVARFPGHAQHDGTGVGDVIADYMESDAEAIVMTGQARKRLFSDFIIAIEDGQYRAPFIESVYNEYKYATVDMLYGSGHPPDSIVAGTMMHARKKRKSGGRATRLDLNQGHTRQDRRQQRAKPVPQATLVYTGNRSFPLQAGGYSWMIEPGWSKEIDKRVADEIVGKFGKFFRIRKEK